MAQPPMPQGPNPGPAPFQQSNQGLAASQQQGGPSPVASLVAATKPRQSRGRTQPSPGPRADFSGIQQAGSAIGSSLRVKYQREWDEKMADKAHKQRMEEQKNVSDLNEASTHRSKVDGMAIAGVDRYLQNQVSEARRDAEGIARAAQARFDPNGLPLTDQWARYDIYRTGSDDLFMEAVTTFAYAEAQIEEDMPFIWQDWINDLHDKAGMDRPMQIADFEARHKARAESVATSTAEESAQQSLDRADMIHGDGGRGFNPTERVAGRMMAEMGNHSLVAHMVQELQHVSDKFEKIKVIDGIADRVKRQHQQRNTRQASLFMGFYGEKYLDVEIDKATGEKSYSYKAMQHHPEMRTMFRDVMRANLERNKGTLAGAGTTNLETSEIGDAVGAFFPGDLNSMVREYLDMPTDEQSLRRASDALKPGSPRGGQFNPELAHVVHSVLGNMKDVMLEITPALPSGDPGENKAQLRNLAQQLSSFYGFTDVDEEDMGLIFGMHSQFMAYIDRGLAATSAQGALDFAIAQQGAAIRMDADEHIKVLLQEGMEPVEAVLEFYNRNMSVFIDMSPQEFERSIIDLFSSLGTPAPGQPVVNQPAENQSVEGVPPTQSVEGAAEAGGITPEPQRPQSFGIEAAPFVKKAFERAGSFDDRPPMNQVQ